MQRPPTPIWSTPTSSPSTLHWWPHRPSWPHMRRSVLRPAGRSWLRCSTSAGESTANSCTIRRRRRSKRRCPRCWICAAACARILPTWGLAASGSIGLGGPLCQRLLADAAGSGPTSAGRGRCFARLAGGLRGQSRLGGNRSHQQRPPHDRTHHSGLGSGLQRRLSDYRGVCRRRPAFAGRQRGRSPDRLKRGRTGL